jgi:hypothetical protein
MDKYFASRRDTLNTAFRTSLEEMMAMYGDSKIKQDGRLELKKEELMSMMTEMARLRDAISTEINNTNKAITRMASRANVTGDLQVELKKSDAQNMVYTADQQMNDAKSMYDHNRILLLIKVAIVLLILVKGNEIYASYRLVFAGASLACIFAYLMFVLFF